MAYRHMAMTVTFSRNVLVYSNRQMRARLLQCDEMGKDSVLYVLNENWETAKLTRLPSQLSAHANNCSV